MMGVTFIWVDKGPQGLDVTEALIETKVTDTDQVC